VRFPKAWSRTELSQPFGALSYLGLARAYALQGDTSKAKAAYQDFLKASLKSIR
jgi:hypothetical protein